MMPQSSTGLSLPCRCGACRIALRGEPIAQLYCHCRDCQLAHGAAYALNTVYPADAVTVPQGELRAVVVRTTDRMQCPQCGTFMFTEVRDAGLRSVNAYLLPPTAFSPACHIYCADAVLPVMDDLPHYADLPHEFGGTDKQVPW